jgi:hypothetical protein
VRLHSLPSQQSSHEMLIDVTQSAHAHPLPKLMQHPGGRQGAPQPGEAPPRGLFGQLRYHQIERMRGRQRRQQMRAPQLRRTQDVTPSASEVARANLGNEVIWNVSCDMKLHSVLLGWMGILTKSCVSPQVLHGSRRRTGGGQVMATVRGLKPSR